MANNCPDVKTTSKAFLISDVLFTTINHFQSSKTSRVTFFGDS